MPYKRGFWIHFGYMIAPPPLLWQKGQWLVSGSVIRAAVLQIANKEAGH